MDNRFESMGKRLDERLGSAVPRLEEELKKAIAYLNDEVVPQIREGSAQALRSASEKLRKVADHLDAHRPGGESE